MLTWVYYYFIIFNGLINTFKAVCFHLYVTNISSYNLRKLKLFWDPVYFSECKRILWLKYLTIAVLLSPRSMLLYRNSLGWSLFSIQLIAVGTVLFIILNVYEKVFVANQNWKVPYGNHYVCKCVCCILCNWKMVVLFKKLLYQASWY